MKTIYMDYNATAPVRVEALAAFEEALRECYGNPASTHGPGRRARAVLDESRERVAAVLGSRPGEVVFTSGGTESDNMAIKGVALAAAAGHIVTTEIEHPAVVEACRFLERECFDVTYLPVDANGLVAVDAVRDALREDTILVSVMWVNNETGVIQPVEEIAAIAREAGVVFHTDAVQAFGRVPVDVKSVPVDLLTISGHKFGAPKGVGALYARKGLALEPLLHGGGQERRARSGTQNAPVAVAMAVAAEHATDGMAGEMARLGQLRDRLEHGLRDRISGAVVNGAGAARVANTSNIRMPGADGEAVLVALDEAGIAASSASACAASHADPSHVLVAMGLSRREAEDSMRFSLGWESTESDVDALHEALPGIVERMRGLGDAPPA